MRDKRPRPSRIPDHKALSADDWRLIRDPLTTIESVFHVHEFAPDYLPENHGLGRQPASGRELNPPVESLQVRFCEDVAQGFELLQPQKRRMRIESTRRFDALLIDARFRLRDTRRCSR